MNAADLASYHAQLTQVAAEAQQLADLRFYVIQEKKAEIERLRDVVAAYQGEIELLKEQLEEERAK
jgi:hypothetical protein